MAEHSHTPVDVDAPIEELARLRLTAQMERFDSFWEGPDDVQKGYRTVYQFYRHNYLPRLPSDRDGDVLVISCGPGYFVDMLTRNGYRNVTGIDSDPEKVEHGRGRGLDCRVEEAFPFLAARERAYDLIVCEQELNHMTKEEIRAFMRLCRHALKPGGKLVVHGLNGANPLTGPEALAQNFDHYNTFTEYTLDQILRDGRFEDIHVFPLNLYVFFRNPLNYAGLAVTRALETAFRIGFILYGKKNRIFTKKLAAIATKPM